MKLEHLIQAYNFNRIPVKIKESMSDYAGVITYPKASDINASYLLDDDKHIEAFVLFSNCIVINNRTIKAQIEHSTDTLIIIQKTMELLSNIKQEEANKILKSLGLFAGKINRKAVKLLNYIYEIDIVGGIMKFSIIENKNESLAVPPLKSGRK